MLDLQSKSLKSCCKNMRTFIVCTILVFCCSVFTYGQKHRTFFYGEDKLKNPVQIPNSVLRILKQDKWVQRCFIPNAQPDFSGDWFEATNINLNNDKFPDILVKGKKDGTNCLNGNADSFWVFIKKQNRYDLVLYVYTITVNIDKRKSKEFFNISTSRSTANATLLTTYTFNGKHYVERRKKWKSL